jgi:2-hydroxychromene-2-carboxylate isomerase
MELNFALDEDINSPTQLSPILTELGLSAADILAQAQAEPTKALLRTQTEQARARGIFGAPTFFVGTEMFRGNDRLDDVHSGWRFGDKAVVHRVIHWSLSRQCAWPYLWLISHRSRRR